MYWPRARCRCGGRGDIGPGQDVNLGLAGEEGGVGEGRPGQVHDVHGDEGGLQQAGVGHVLLNLHATHGYLKCYLSLADFPATKVNYLRPVRTYKNKQIQRYISAMCTTITGISSVPDPHLKKPSSEEHFLFNFFYFSKKIWLLAPVYNLPHYIGLVTFEVKLHCLTKTITRTYF